MRRERLIAAAFVLFQAWFSLAFYFDNSNDSENMAYGNALVGAASQLGLSADATGHYAGLVPYLVYPLARLLQPISGIAEVRAFMVVRFLLALLTFAAAYAWYRRVGLGWLTSLVGLFLLSSCMAFALQIRGWELDKLAEPALYLLAALAISFGRYWLLVPLTVVAVLNRETGIFMPLLALAGGAPRSVTVACVASAAAVFVPLRLLGPVPTIAPATALPINLRLERLVYVVGGLFLTPLLAAVWHATAPSVLRRCMWIVVPPWSIWLLATDHLEQGAVLLSLVAIVFVPTVLAAVTAQPQVKVATHSM
jgi:hypothetical protein